LDHSHISDRSSIIGTREHRLCGRSLHHKILVINMADPTPKADAIRRMREERAERQEAAEKVGRLRPKPKAAVDAKRKPVKKSRA
jgi:hypothetical protein